MPRNARPWPRKGRGWYVTVGGKQIPLAPEGSTKDQAEKAWHALMAAEGKADHAEALPLLALANLFLDEVLREIGEESHTFYARFLGPFTERWPDLAAPAVRPMHVTRWLADKTTWGPGTKANAIRSLKRLTRWARQQGYMPTDPLADMPSPPSDRREEVVSPDQVATVFVAIPDEPFRRFVLALWLSGCRPKEIRLLIADRVDLEAGVWKVPNKTRRKTGQKFRAIVLTPGLVELSRELCREHPTGPIFRNTRGEPWTPRAIGKRFERLRAKLGFGPELSAYAYRHRWATDAIMAGLPAPTVATMMGHTSPAMIAKHYSHVDQHRAYLREAATRVRPDGPPAVPGSDASGGTPLKPIGEEQRPDRGPEKPPESKPKDKLRSQKV